MRFIHAGLLVLTSLVSLWSADAATLRVACVGDSITEMGGYPAIVQRLLTATGGKPVEVANFGRSGATLLKKGDVPYWNQPQYAAATAFAPNAVVIMLGTNDSKPQNWSHHESFVADLSELVQVFAKLPTKPAIWLALPPPAYQENFGIRGSVIEQELLPLIREVASREKLPVIDVFTAMSKHAEMFPDGVHPNEAGCELLAQTVAAGLSARPAKKP